MEAAALMVAGYSDRLEVGRWGSVPMVAPKEVDGRCTFLDDKGKCQLHDKGLKPLEGRVAICGVSKGHRHAIAEEWAVYYEEELAESLRQTAQANALVVTK